MYKIMNTINLYHYLQLSVSIVILIICYKGTVKPYCSVHFWKTQNKNTFTKN